MSIVKHMNDESLLIRHFLTVYIIIRQKDKSKKKEIWIEVENYSEESINFFIAKLKKIKQISKIEKIRKKPDLKCTFKLPYICVHFK